MPQPVECSACGFVTWVSRSQRGAAIRCTECATVVFEPKQGDSSKPRKKKRKKKKRKKKKEAVSALETSSSKDANSESDLVDAIVDDWLADDGLGDTQFSHVYPSNATRDDEDDDDWAGVYEAGQDSKLSDPVIDGAGELTDEPDAPETVEAAVSSLKKADATPLEPKAEASHVKPEVNTQKPVPSVRIETKPMAPAHASKKSSPKSQGPKAGPRISPPRSAANDPYDRIDPLMIRLMVREITPNTVSIEFPAQLLELSGFRASIPMRCIVNPEASVDGLIGKPFPWVDKLKRSKETAREMANRFAKKVPADFGEAQYVDSLHLIMELPSPFNLPMPFYISKEEEKGFEPLTRVVGTKYGLGCVVLLPVNETVLEWVGRVNGLYSKECHDLSRVVHSQTNQEMQSLSGKTRQRIKEWFACRHDEQFLTFLPDSDFARKDEGLAGLVLTDRRMVCRKYNQRVELSLAQPRQLITRQDGRFTDITLSEEGGSARKLVRLRREGAYLVSLLLENLGTYVTMTDGGEQLSIS